MNERKADDPRQRIDPDDPAQLHFWLTSLAVTEAQLRPRFSSRQRPS